MTDNERAMQREIDTWRERYDSARAHAAALESERDALRREVAGLETAFGEADIERERMSDALIEAHRALGGDGEWKAKPGQACAAGDTGDLAIDVPALCEQERAAREKSVAENEQLRREVAELCEDATDAQKSLNALRDQTKCPDCGCATPEEAEANECGCDGPVCAVDASKTLAEHYITERAAREKAEAERDALKERETEAIAAVPRWCNGPGLLGAILHLVERLEGEEAVSEQAEARALAAEKERDRLLGILHRSYGHLPCIPGETLAWVDSNIEPHIVAIADEWVIRERQLQCAEARAARLEALLRRRSDPCWDLDYDEKNKLISDIEMELNQ